MVLTALRDTIEQYQNRRTRVKAQSQYWALAAIILSVGGLHSAAAESLLAWEQKPRVVEDRFLVEFGALASRLDTIARVDFSPDAPGTEFSAEDDFGLPTDKLLVLPELTLLPGKRHLIRLGGFSLKREGHKIIERDVDFDEDFFTAGHMVDSTLNIEVVELTYGYKAVKLERFEAAAILGIDVIDVRINAEMRGLTNREASGELAPIPVAGLEMRMELSDRIALELRGHYASVAVDTTSGSITDLRGGLTWRMNPHLVAGIGYRSYDLSAESQGDDSSGLVHFKMSGPLLFFRASL